MNQLRLQATLGDHNLNVKEGTEVNRKISKIVQVVLDFCQYRYIYINSFNIFDFINRKHPFYNTTRNPYLWDYDIALMKLDSPVNFSDTISPVCLPGGRVPKIGDVGIVIGWVVEQTVHSLFNLD